MQKLGPVFRQLRLARHLTLQQVADDQCSLAFISKFERDERAIGFTRLWHLLDRINVTPEEFFQALIPRPAQAWQQAPDIAPLASLTTPYGPFTLELVETISQNTSASRSVTQAQLLAMKQLGAGILEVDGGTARWQQFLQLSRDIGVVIVKSNQKADPLLDDQLFDQLAQMSQPVVAYLFTLDAWGIFEFTLLRLFAAAIPPATVHRLIKLAVTRSHAVRQLPQGQALVMVVLQGAVSKFINNKQYAWASEVLASRTTLTPEDGVRWALETRFLTGWLHLAQGDTTGDSMCQTVVSMLETLGLHQWSSKPRLR